MKQIFPKGHFREQIEVIELLPRTALTQPTSCPSSFTPQKTLQNRCPRLRPIGVGDIGRSES
ncbi:MAG: hypothetical protein K2O61_04035, partial [Bacteroidaceae bacterium]|nr:hypothetical protein [Bacteroidaceae bacterium]